ncbi:hypothetical protein CAOG_004806 [Capsaspora owczarzaki ATCC 30864]|uniref:Uncharacterized protein n=2 Tax=Capsaspora owczarzaki (strain ATCC 30864) TaxID=595528 RepID=A0A0D2WS11_CAPO3|nr:hypothetical protein CAOG_004806 [Capsaspora owczarzaki ATCC 30864]
MKELQRFRQRKSGVTPAGLALGQRVKSVAEELLAASDPFKLKSGGGLVDKAAIRVKDRDRDRDADDDKNFSLTSTFSHETKARDEDKMMLSYIDEQLAIRRGTNANDNANNANDPTAQLYVVPKNLEATSALKNVSEDSISSALLSGIPEVDLGVQSRIRNIEETEKARIELEQKRLSGNQSSNVVLHHHRFFNTADRSDRSDSAGAQQHGSQNSSAAARQPRATDQLVFDKFKKAQLGRR